MQWRKQEFSMRGGRGGGGCYDGSMRGKDFLRGGGDSSHFFSYSSSKFWKFNSKDIFHKFRKKIVGLVLEWELQ